MIIMHAAAVGPGFLCKSMGFQNTAGPQGHQAVALRVQSDLAAFFNCRMDGYQDTLYVQTHRQFYRNCVISGTVDFIFGDAAVVIQNSLIIVRKPMDNQQNTVTAQGRADKRETSGLVIHNCRIVPEQKLFPARFQIRTYLGRPWKQYSRTVIMESTLADFVQPAGFLPWAGNFALDTCSYLEYANRGPGANTNRRVRWKGVRAISRREALQFTVGPFIQGNLWLKATGAPFMLGLRHWSGHAIRASGGTYVTGEWKALGSSRDNTFNYDLNLRDVIDLIFFFMLKMIMQGVANGVYLMLWGLKLDNKVYCIIIWLTACSYLWSECCMLILWSVFVSMHVDLLSIHKKTNKTKKNLLFLLSPEKKKMYTKKKKNTMYSKYDDPEKGEKKNT